MRSKYTITTYLVDTRGTQAYQITRVDRTHWGQFIREVILKQYHPAVPKDKVQQELRDGTFFNSPIREA